MIFPKSFSKFLLNEPLLEKAFMKSTYLLLKKYKEEFFEFYFQDIIFKIKCNFYGVRIFFS